MVSDDRGSKDPETKSGSIKTKPKCGGVAATVLRGLSSCSVTEPCLVLWSCSAIGPAFIERHAKIRIA